MGFGVGVGKEVNSISLFFLFSTGIDILGKLAIMRNFWSFKRFFFRDSIKVSHPAKKINFLIFQLQNYKDQIKIYSLYFKCKVRNDQMKIFNNIMIIINKVHFPILSELLNKSSGFIFVEFLLLPLFTGPKGI